MCCDLPHPRGDAPAGRLIGCHSDTTRKTISVSVVVDRGAAGRWGESSITADNQRTR